jgi:hypothetical protein
VKLHSRALAMLRGRAGALALVPRADPVGLTPLIEVKDAMPLVRDALRSRTNASTSTHAAVCITGQLRQFPRTVRVIETGLSDLLSNAFIVGIHPQGKSLGVVAKQIKCELHIPWRYSCDGRYRPHCKDNFVQTLCDARYCLTKIEEKEFQIGRTFKTIARIRPDTLWEIPVRLPSIRSHEVHVPAMNPGWQNGVNDQFVVGGRAAMTVYLNRISDVAQAINGTRKVATSERFLSLVLKQHNVKVVLHSEWMYCLLSYRSYELTAQDPKSCIYRWIHKTPCQGLRCNTQCLCTRTLDPQRTPTLYLEHDLNLSRLTW